MLKRKAYDKLLKWKHESAGKTALLIEGARRVGKSTLARTFGETEYKSCLVIDFFQAPAEVKQYFEDYRTDFDSLFLYLSVFYNVKLYEHETLIVFDEVQMTRKHADSSSISLQTDVTTTSKLDPCSASSRTLKISSSHPRKSLWNLNPSTLRSFFGAWTKRGWPISFA